MGLAAELRAHDVAFEKFGRNYVEKLGDLLADTLERIRIGSDKVGDDLGGFYWEVFQSGDSRAVGTTLLR